ncbi:MAG: hypothetical protein RLN88_07780 [Ekhidna sp.]|uniref:hypothetical protein n=1 Tax=Ekhidna sp. TaxID=2608089 RepID=UPI0032ECAE26
MKRKLFTALVIVGALSLTACQEDAAMEELLQDTELNSLQGEGDGDEDDTDKPGSSN